MSPTRPICIDSRFAPTGAQVATARAFARLDYRGAGHSHGCLVLRDRRGDRVEIDERGLVVPHWLA